MPKLLEYDSCIKPEMSIHDLLMIGDRLGLNETTLNMIVTKRGQVKICELIDDLQNNIPVKDLYLKNEFHAVGGSLSRKRLSKRRKSNKRKSIKRKSSRKKLSRRKSIKRKSSRKRLSKKR